MNDRDDILAKALGQWATDAEVKIVAELAGHIEAADTSVRKDRHEALERARDSLAELVVAIGNRVQE